MLLNWEEWCNGCLEEQEEDQGIVLRVSAEWGCVADNSIQ